MISRFIHCLFIYFHGCNCTINIILCSAYFPLNRIWGIFRLIHKPHIIILMNTSVTLMKYSMSDHQYFPKAFGKCQGTRWNLWVMALAWLCPSTSRHLGNEPADRKYLLPFFLSLLPHTYIFFYDSNVCACVYAQSWAGEQNYSLQYSSNVIGAKVLASQTVRHQIPKG